MIEQQIRPWDVLDHDVLDLLAVVRREDFVPPAHRALAFVDTEMPLLRRPSGAAAASACWSPRSRRACCRTCTCSATTRCSKSAPARATWPRCWRTGRQRVITLEIQPELAQMARANLQRAGIANVEVREADGAKGLAGRRRRST